MASKTHTPAATFVTSTEDGHARARILVTDDRPEMLLAIDRSLGDLYECEFAATVVEARRRLFVEDFKLAICDVNAAGEQAMALAEEILVGHPEIAVVLVTGEDDPEVAGQAFELGAHGYLVEPLQPGQLLITVMNGLRWRELELGREARSRNLREQSQTIIDMVPIPIYAKDASHRYLVANSKAEDLAGFKRGSSLGKTDKDLMEAASAGPAATADDIVFEGAPVHEVDQTAMVGGVERFFHTVHFPLRDERGEIVAVGGISIDLTDQRQALRLRDELAAAQSEAIEELRHSREETVERLVRAIEHHDPATGLHVVRIGRVAALLATHLGLPPERVELLRVAAPMHDIGKIGTPPEILQKPGPLDPAEREEMERHAVIGHEILADSASELLRMAATIALTHHERYDGKGYPRGLAGERIPMVGRITAVADVFDALLSDRCYRPALPLDEVAALIEGGRGTQFDPRVVDVLLGRLDEVLAARG